MSKYQEQLYYAVDVWYLLDTDLKLRLVTTRTM